MGIRKAMVVIIMAAGASLFEGAVSAAPEHSQAVEVATPVPTAGIIAPKHDTIYHYVVWDSRRYDGTVIWESGWRACQSRKSTWIWTLTGTGHIYYIINNCRATCSGTYPYRACRYVLDIHFWHG